MVTSDLDLIVSPNETFELHCVAGDILCENSFNLKTISQGDFGHLGENNQIIVSKVAKIALRDCF